MSDDGSFAGRSRPSRSRTHAGRVRRARRRRGGRRADPAPPRGAGTYAMPFFGWFVGFQAWLAARGAVTSRRPRRRGSKGAIRRRSRGGGRSSRRFRSRPSRPPAWPRSPFVAHRRQFLWRAAHPERRRRHRHLSPDRLPSDWPWRSHGSAPRLAHRDRARRPVRAPQADPGALAGAVIGEPRHWIWRRSFEVFTGAQLFTRAL